MTISTADFPEKTIKKRKRLSPMADDPSPEEQEGNRTMPPSVTDTDAEESDPEETNTSEELIKTAEDNQKQFEKTTEGESSDSAVSEQTSDEKKEEEEREERDATAVAEDQSEYHGVTRSSSSIDTSTRSFHPKDPDVHTDDAPTGLRQELPRGATCTEELVESTHEKGAPPSVRTPSVTVNQRIGVEEEEITIRETEEEETQSTHIACHPSKLIRDNSASTQQPPSKLREPLEMAPNLRLPSSVEEEPDELIYTAISRVLEKGSSADASSVANVIAVADVHDLDTSSTRSTPPREQTESGFRSRAQVPPSRTSPPNTEEIPESGNVMIAPPGAILFHHANGEQAFLPPGYQHHGYGYPMQMQHGMHPAQMMATQLPAPAPPSGSGRRKITLRLQEDDTDSSRKSFFFRRSSKSSVKSLQSIVEAGIDRGTVTVSWFEGTSSTELQEHVRKSVVRKMNLDSDGKLSDLRIIDQSEDPPEGMFQNSANVYPLKIPAHLFVSVVLVEIVLSPFIPDGSSFLLRFNTRAGEKQNETKDPHASGHSAPESPSAAKSPYPSNIDLASLNAQLLTGKLNALKPALSTQRRKSALKNKQFAAVDENMSDEDDDDDDVHLQKVDETDNGSKGSDHHEGDVMGYNPEDQIEVRLRQIADLMIADRKSRRSNRVTTEKRQVIFVIANYFVLFLSFIAICAELSSRSPKWLSAIESQLDSVHKCSTDQEALFECVSKGDFAGLVASFILFLTKSAATKSIFLFGFETPHKLWTVVYESLVTAFCWGTSYIVIRRGMNPDTRVGFLQKYWKDAVYGSLAGFNAAFLKHVLKNLIPQEAFEDALQEALHERQLKILSWLPSFH